MKTFGKGLAIGLLVGLVLFFAAPLVAQNVSCYLDQGGAGFHAGSGCTVTIESGGVINIASGGALKIGGTTVTATANALNTITPADVTATATEINTLAGVTAGTVTAGKAIVTTTSKHIDALVITDGGLALGAGAGTVVTATAAQLNVVPIALDIADLSAEATYYVVMPHAGKVKKIWSVIDGAVSTADVTLTCNIGATPITTGVVTIATAGSAAGDVDSATPTAANTVTAGAAINCVVTGGGSGGSPRGHVVFELNRE
jgi:hypothetical protein